MKTLSKKPNKKRKTLYTAPSHMRGKSCYAPLAPELREKYGTRSMRVVKGDTVIILRGEYTGIEGKISNVEPKASRLQIEGITREKVDGTTIFVPIHPSKVMIKRFNLDDDWRKDILERRTSKTPIRKREVKKTKKNGEK
jgi:large subunit ribosomal protein L24